MTHNVPEFAQVVGLLGRVRREWHAARILGGLWAFLGLTLTATFVAVLAAMIFAVGTQTRWAIMISWASILLASFVVFFVMRLMENPSEEEIALLLESAHPELNNEMINAVCFSRSETEVDEPFVKAALRESSAVASRIEPRGAVNWRKTRVNGALLGVAALFWVVLLIAYPGRVANAFMRILSPTANLPTVGSFRILGVTPGDVTVVAGESLAVEAVFEEKGEEAPTAFVRHFVADGPVHEEKMQRVDKNRCRAELIDIRAPRTYRVALGDSLSRDYHISVTERPIVTRIGVAFRYPEYTGLAAASVEDCGGTVRAVKGSKAALRIETNKPLASARLNFGEKDQPTLDLQPGHQTAVTLSPLEIVESRAGHIEIADEFSCSNTRPLQITAVEDRAPQVKIAAPAADRVIGVGESLDIDIRGNDDFGVVRAELVEKRIAPGADSTGEPKTVREWSGFSDGKNVSIQWRWSFDKKSYQNGETIRYFVRMTDGNTVDGPGTGASAEFAVRLEDAAALQQEREKKYEGWQAELENVLKEQKDLRSRTEEMESRVGVDPGKGSEKKAPVE